LRSTLKELAHELGFASVGICGPERPIHFEAYRDWIRAGRHGTMQWMERSLGLREDPARLLPGCRAVICLAHPYRAERPTTEDGLVTARYCEPDLEDYHRRLREKGRRIMQALGKLYPGSKARFCVDSAPLLERSLAFSAALGFIGKNTSLIVPDYGSYVFLSEILTTAPISFERPEPPASLCGSCSLCIEACPTGALERPYLIDASRCLSFRTIEDEAPLDAASAKLMGRRFLGCDICQEVCPHNKGPQRDIPVMPHSREILSMEKESFLRLYGKSALARPGLEKIKDNIRAVLSLSPLRA
jgi:epoxyqueuosine reductase